MGSTFEDERGFDPEAYPDYVLFEQKEDGCHLIVDHRDVGVYQDIKTAVLEAQMRGYLYG